MPVSRGSKQTILGIAEATFGTTPATPTMLEMPVTNFTRRFNKNMIQSGQIRSHPFLDRQIVSAFDASFDIGWELQDDNHDLLLAAMCGGSVWTTNAIKVQDALQGVTLQAGAIDLTKFDQLPGSFFTSLEFNFPAQIDGIVTVSGSGLTKSPTMDAAATLASVTTPATNVDPFVFSGATVTLAGGAVNTTALTLRVERQVDPLYILGQASAYDYIPSMVRVSGQITVPYEGTTESTRLAAGAAFALVAKASDAAGGAGSNFRTFTVPQAKYLNLERSYSDRGVIMQVINWEAQYDSASATVMTVSRSA